MLALLIARLMTVSEPLHSADCYTHSSMLAYSEAKTVLVNIWIVNITAHYGTVWFSLRHWFELTRFSSTSGVRHNVKRSHGDYYAIYRSIGGSSAANNGFSGC